MVEFLRPKQLGEDEEGGAGDESDRRESVGRGRRFKVIGRVGERIKKLLRAPFKTRRRKIITLSLLSLLLLLFLLVIVIPAAVLYLRAKALKPSAEGLQAALADKDLETAEASLEELSTNFDGLERVYSRLSYLRWVPFVNRYYLDGVHALTAGRLVIEVGEVVISSLRPHEEVLGLKKGFGSQITVEQQLANVLGTLPKLVDDLDAVWGKLLLIQREVDEIDPNRYPQEIRGVKVRFWLEEVQKILTEAEPLIKQGRSFLKLTPQLLGVQNRRTYLVVFQNDAEIRATGGFMTALSLFTVSDGKVVSNEVYPGTYPHASQPYYSPPKPLGEYLGISSWLFHDVNYYPDFPTSAKKILEVWSAAHLPRVSGVLVVNTNTAASLLKITGPLEMSPYNLDLAGYDLPSSCKNGGKKFTSGNLVCRLEFYVERSPVGGGGAATKKDLLGRLSEEIIQKITNSSAEIWPQLIDLVFEFLEEKNLMAYMVKSDEQTFVKNLGYAGEIKEFDGDYLHINDNNFGGRKTDMFMTQQVDQSLAKLEDGTWRKTVSIKYYNPQKYDNWVSAIYRDFVRLYVPKGSKLVSVTGANYIWSRPNQSSKKIQNPAGWTEFGKTVFGAFFNVEPQKERTLTFTYDLPESVVGAGEYKLLMQKQSGTNIGLVKLEIGGKIESFDLETDQEIILPIVE